MTAIHNKYATPHEQLYNNGPFHYKGLTSMQTALQGKLQKKNQLRQTVENINTLESFGEELSKHACITLQHPESYYMPS